MNSSYYDKLKQTSQYHFDNTHRDQPGEWFTTHGKFEGAWQQELQQLKTDTKPLTWRNISSSLGHKTPQTQWTPEREARVQSQELDITRGGGDPEMALTDVNIEVNQYPVFSSMIESFGLESVHARIHVQRTGQVFNMHIDTYGVGFPNVPEDKLIRITVMLEDWVPGQFYCYGTYNYSHWPAGEFHTFRWKDVPHGTANASSVPRTSLIITGIMTDKTINILNTPYTLYKV